MKWRKEVLLTSFSITYAGLNRAFRNIQEREVGRVRMGRRV